MNLVSAKPVLPKSAFCTSVWHEHVSVREEQKSHAGRAAALRPQDNRHIEPIVCRVRLLYLLDVDRRRSDDGVSRHYDQHDRRQTREAQHLTWRGPMSGPPGRFKFKMRVLAAHSVTRFVIWPRR